MANTKTPRPRTVTYLGVPCEVTSVTFTGGPNSERVVRRHWLGKASGQPTEWTAGTWTEQTLVGRGRDSVTTIPEHAVEVS